MHWTPAPSSSRRDRPRWVIPELDVHGEIDEHAAMCLQYAIEGARAAAPVTIVVDLRELEAISTVGLELFVRHEADCRSRGIELGLLICADERQDAIARALDEAGLGDQLQFTYAPPPGPRARPRVRHVSAAWLRRLQRG